MSFQSRNSLNKQAAYTYCNLERQWATPFLPNVRMAYKKWKYSNNFANVSDNVSGADSVGHRGHVPSPPPLSQMVGHGGTASRRTANYILQ